MSFFGIWNAGNEMEIPLGVISHVAGSKIPVAPSRLMSTKMFQLAMLDYRRVNRVLTVLSNKHGGCNGVSWGIIWINNQQIENDRTCLVIYIDHYRIELTAGLIPFGSLNPDLDELCCELQGHRNDGN